MIKEYYSYHLALKDCTPGSFQNIELCNMVADKTLNHIKKLDEKAFILTPTNVFLLSSIYHYLKTFSVQKLNILDFGGACGAHYFEVRKFIPENILLNWYVVETPRMVSSAKEKIKSPQGINYPELHFIDSFNHINSKIDFIHSSSALQYVDNPYQILSKLIELNADWILFNRMIFNENERDFITIQSSYLSSNGPGPLPYGYSDKIISYPHTTMGFNKFNSMLLNNYDLELQSDEQSGSHNINNERISGKVLLYIRKDKGLKKVKKLVENVLNTKETKLSTFSPMKHPSCLFLNVDYLQFLISHYEKNPGLKDKTYKEQIKSIQNEFFGDSNFYSEALKKFNWNSEDIILNCFHLQQSWAKENSFFGNDFQILLEQIKRKRPDVVYFQDIAIANDDFLDAIKPYTNLIAGQIASPVPEMVNLSRFDIIFTSFPHFAENFKKSGLNFCYQPLSFEPVILENIKDVDKKYDVTFVGSISAVHAKRKDFLEKLAELVPVDFFGIGIDSLDSDSPIKKRYKGEAWGIDMFKVLCASKITVNFHIDVAENNANNMRLFEATGCGTLLITDYKENLKDLFEPGKEIVVYHSVEECAELIKYYLEHPEEAEQIAYAGQQKTLKEHTYEKRMKFTSEILKYYLQKKLKPVKSDYAVNMPSEDLFDGTEEDLKNSIYLKPVIGIDYFIEYKWNPNREINETGYYILLQKWEGWSLPENWIIPLIRDVDQLWVPGRFVKESYINAGINKEKIEIIPPGINTDKFRPGVSPLQLHTATSFKFLYSGSIIDRKGINLLLEAFTEEFGESDDVCLVIRDNLVDVTPENFAIREKIRLLKQKPEIIFYSEELEKEQVPGLYTAADCLVYPYKSEGYPIQVLEAMSSGLPVIVTNGGASLDYCNNDNSYLIDALWQEKPENKLEILQLSGNIHCFEPDKNHLKKLMRHVFTDRNEAKNKGIAGRETVINKLSRERISEKISGAFAKLKTKPINRFNPKLFSQEIGAYKLSKGDYKAAVEEFVKAMKAGAENKDLFTSMAFCLEKLGDLKTAEIFHKKAEML